MYRPTGINVLNTILSSGNNAKIITLVVDETDSTPIYLNDPVKNLTNSDEITGWQKCTRATPSDFIRGIVVGVQAEQGKEDILYRKANTKRFLLVREDPFIYCKATVNAVILSTDVNRYLNIDSAGGNTATATSEIALDYATIDDASGQFRITRIVKIVDTDDEKYSIVECVIQKQEYMRGHVSGGDNWDRTGTTLIPTNLGDDVALGTGDISATNGEFTGNVDIDGKLTVIGSIDPIDLQLTPQGSAPSVITGNHYYDSVLKQHRFGEDGVWQPLGGDLTPYVKKDGDGTVQKVAGGETSGRLTLKAFDSDTKEINISAGGLQSDHIMAYASDFTLTDDKDITHKKYVDNLTYIQTTPVTTYYIHINGNDSTGDGSEAFPFLTVQKAIDFIKLTFTPSPTQRFTVKAVAAYNFPESIDFSNADYIDGDFSYCNFRCNTFIIGDNNIITIGQIERLSGVGIVIQKKGTGKSVLNIGTLKNDISFGLINMFNGTLEVYANEVLGLNRNATIVDFDAGASDSKCIIRANTIQGRSFTTTTSSQVYLYADHIGGDLDINAGVASIAVISGRNWGGNILNAGALSTIRVSVLERSFVIAQDNIDPAANLVTYDYMNAIGKGTGLLEGCAVSVGSTTQQYNVAEGWGVISNEYTAPLHPTAKVQYVPAVIDATDPYTTLPFTGLSVDSTGDVTTIPADLIPAGEDRDKFLIGILTHQDFTQITNAVTITDGDISASSNRDLSRTIGFLQQVGAEFKLTPFATDTRLSISAGTVWGLGAAGKATAAARKNPNFLTRIAKTPMVIIYIFRDGLGGFLTWSTTTPQVGGEDPTLWDDGTVVTPGNPPNGSVLSNQWTVQRHYKDATNDLELALFSQTSGYGTRLIALTERVIEELIVPDFIRFLVPLQQRVIQNNASYDNSNKNMAVNVVSGRYDNSAVT